MAKYLVRVTLEFYVIANSEDEVREELFKYIETSDYDDIVELEIKEV